MSNQRFTMGLIALLKEPVGDLHTEEWEQLSEKLYDSGSKLFPTYGGDMIAYRHIDVPVYEAGLMVFDPKDHSMAKAFNEQLLNVGISIVTGSMRGFIDNWYDAADSNHIDLTREEAGYGKKDAVPVR